MAAVLWVSWCNGKKFLSLVYGGVFRKAFKSLPGEALVVPFTLGIFVEAFVLMVGQRDSTAETQLFV